MGVHQTKKLLHSKGNRQQKKKATCWVGEDMSKWYTSQKWYISKTAKGLIECIGKNTQNPILKWGKALNGHFCKEEIQMANRHMKRCSTSSPQGLENQDHSWSTSSYLSSKKCWGGCREKETLLRCWWKRIPVQPLWRQWGFPQKLKTRTTIWSSSSTSWYFLKNRRNTSHKTYMRASVHWSVIYSQGEPRYGRNLSAHR